MSEIKFSLNALYNVLYKLLNVLFPLVSIAIISRVLLPEGVGKVSSAQNIVTYFTFLAPLGISFYGIREVSKCKPEELDILFSELITINGISTIICTVCYYLLVTINPYFSGERTLYYVTGISIFLNLFNVDWFYQGKEEYKYIAIRSTIVKVLMLFSIVVFVKNESDYIKYAFIVCLATAGNYFFNVFNLRKYKVKLIFSRIELRRHIRPLFILLASNLAVELYSLVDTTMLSVMCSPSVVGYYSNAMKLTKVAIFVITAIGGVTLPRIAPFVERGDINSVESIVGKIVKIMMFFAIPAGVGMVAVSDKIVYVLFGDAFVEAVPTVCILSTLFYVLTLSNFLGTQVLVAFYRERDVLVASVFGAITNILLNFFLIAKWEQNGAAIASVISELVVACLTLFYTRRKINIRISMRYLFTVILSALSMGLCAIFVKNLISNNVISLIITMMLSVMVYFVANIILRNEIIVTIISSIRKGQEG